MLTRFLPFGWTSQPYRLYINFVADQLVHPTARNQVEVQRLRSFDHSNLLRSELEKIQHLEIVSRAMTFNTTPRWPFYAIEVAKIEKELKDITALYKG